MCPAELSLLILQYTQLRLITQINKKVIEIEACILENPSDELVEIRTLQIDIFDTRLKSIVIDRNRLKLSINIKSQWKSIGRVFVIIDFTDFCN